MSKTWQQDWIRDPAYTPLANQELMELDYWRAGLGARRLSNVGRLLGDSEAQSLAEALGTYELDFQLTLKVQSQGAELSASGEFEILSPSRWRHPIEEAKVALNWQQKWQREGKELVALVLSTQEKARFLSFLSKSNATVASPWDLWEYFEHFFFGEKDKLKVITETRQRV